MTMAAKGACLNHVSRESSDIQRLAEFYKEILDFEEMESPNLRFKVIWLSLPSTGFFLHLIEQLPEARLPEGSYSTSSLTIDPKYLPRGHHVCFTVSNFDSFVQTLKEKGIETFQRALSNGKVKQIFFFHLDGLSEEDKRVLRGSKFALLLYLPPPSQPRLAHPGGAIMTNKAVALAKFLERKLQMPRGLASVDPNLAELIVKDAKACGTEADALEKKRGRRHAQRKRRRRLSPVTAPTTSDATTSLAITCSVTASALTPFFRASRFPHFPENPTAHSVNLHRFHFVRFL